MGIILGLSPWKTAVDLWTDKVYGAKFKGNAATRRGNQWEPIVIANAEEYLSCVIHEDVRFERHYEIDGHTVKFAANTDGVVIRGDGRDPAAGDDLFFGAWVPDAVVEAKTARSLDHWGTPGTDEIPDTYLVQTYCQMWCSGAQLAWVPVQSGFDFFMYKVPRPPEDALEEMIRRCAEWWAKHVVPQVRPEGPPPKISVLSSIERTGADAVDLGDGYGIVVQDWLEATQRRLDAVRDEDELKRKIIEALGRAEIGLVPNGHVTYFANKAGARTLKFVRAKWEGEKS